MRGPSCVNAAMLDAKRASGLSTSEGLRLEEHVAVCAHCASETALLRALRGLVQQQDGVLAAPVREQVMERAFASAGRVRRPAQIALGRVWIAGAGALAAAALAWLGLRATEPAASRLASVESGAVLLAGKAISQGEPIAEGALIEARADAKLAIAHARVTLEAGSRAVLRASAHEIELRAGELLAEVDPARKAPFAVRTARFSVHVLGTRFVVSERAVEVLEGRVRVVDRSGKPLAQLGAGERFEDAQPARAERKPEPAPLAEDEALAEPPIAALETDAAQAPSEASGQARKREPHREAREAPRADEPASSVLARARRELAARNVERARATVNEALAAEPSAAERAEALTLRAECELVDGDRAGAARAYLVVADRFDHLPAGENALFAAVRLYSELGQRELAASLVQRYLTRYPNGRFVSEARRRARGHSGQSVAP